eukprot:50025_1
MIELALLLCVVVRTQSSHPLVQHRQGQLDRMTNHELIRVHLDEVTNNVIEFDAFGTNYKVKLILNEHSNPTLLLLNDEGTLSEHGGENEQLCHYHGKVLNIEAASRVALSLCAGEGVRGTVQILDGDELIINPSSYYHAPFATSLLTDEHLVYKTADYGYDPMTLSSIPIAANGAHVRRRLGNAAGSVELVSLVNKYWVDHLGGISKSLSFFKGVVNEASSFFTNNNLPNEVEFNIVHRYLVFDNAGRCRGKLTCLERTKAYFKQKMHRAYDFGFGFWLDPNIPASEDGGVAYGGAICPDGDHNFGVLRFNTKNPPNQHVSAHTLAHELAHNVGVDHDDSTGNIMYKWLQPKTQWTAKSWNAMKRKKRSGAWSCLNHNGGTNTVARGNYGNKLGRSVASLVQEDVDCSDKYENAMCLYNDYDDVNTTSAIDIDIDLDPNGEALVFELVEEEGCVNGEPVFGNDLYFIQRSEYDNWMVTQRVIRGEDSNILDAFGVCEEEDLRDCTQGQWLREVMRKRDEVDIEVLESVSIKACAIQRQSMKKREGKAADVSVIVAIVLLVVILIVCGVFIWRKKQKGNASFDQKIDNESEEEEVVEIDTTTNHLV